MIIQSFSKMYTASSIVIASQLLATVSAAPLLSNTGKLSRSLVERSAYKVFGGDGTPAQGWPQESEWLPFEKAWSANVATTLISCSQFSQENNSNEESENIKKAILEVAAESSIKPEFLLSIVMQESKGCVRAPTTANGFANPGLMQSFEGTHSCNTNGAVQNPCPYDVIKGMIEDGAGVGREAGLTQSLKQSAANDVSKYYKAARIYNSGHVDESGNLGAGIATHCYATDVANRLIGWTDTESHDCQEGSIGAVTGGAPNNAPAGAGSDASQGVPSDSTTTPPPPPPANNGGAAQPTGDKFAGAVASCTKWYTVKVRSQYFTNRPIF